MSASIIENHKITTMEHDLQNEGYFLSEKKKRTVVKAEDPESSTKMVMVHLRSIDDRYYKVTELTEFNDRCCTDGKNVERMVETEMSTEEIENFEIDWELYWKPALNEEVRSNMRLL